MKIVNLIFFTFLLFNGFGQSFTQNIRGTIIDRQSEHPIPGVQVRIVGSEPLIGGITDINGVFVLKNIPVGRVELQAKFIGYQTVTLNNLELTSGKELNLNIGLEENVEQLKTVEVTLKKEKGGTINKMATVSARTLSIKEAGKFAGTLNDPSRMAQNYAGVSGVSDERNDIIIRGNSPLGVLWRMDGIDIPSPNHFSALGTTGGPVSMLNINNLSNSDFFTSAWTANYGNAFSGVFDLRLRNGNSTKREHMAQVGFNGFEFGTEGYFSKNSRASYLINYRYSTLGVISALGIDLGTGVAVPQYQDITFKLNFPTKKIGRISIWGIGGVSNITIESDTSENLFAGANERTDFYSKTGVIGLSHKYFINPKTFTELVMAYSYTKSGGAIDRYDDNNVYFNVIGFSKNKKKHQLTLK